MVGLFAISIPRLLLLLCNHKNIFKKVIQEINSTNEDDKINEKIYKLKFLRKCILETLRLNNPVITTFRTLNEDYTFDNKHSLKKGTQFVILNNPVLRENEYFKKIPINLIHIDGHLKWKNLHMQYHLIKGHKNVQVKNYQYI